jgi:hypothetical protein
MSPVKKKSNMDKTLFSARENFTYGKQKSTQVYITSIQCCAKSGIKKPILGREKQKKPLKINIEKKGHFFSAFFSFFHFFNGSPACPLVDHRKCICQLGPPLEEIKK